MDALATLVLSATRRSIFRQKPVFKSEGKVSPDDLRALEQRIGVPIPEDLRDWLLRVGYGDLDDTLSFREEWFAKVEAGQLKGGAIFAEDILGNLYAFDGTRGRIFYLSRSEAVFALVGESFADFLESLVQRDYKLMDWVSGLKTEKYDW